MKSKDLKVLIFNLQIIEIGANNGFHYHKIVHRHLKKLHLIPTPPN